jgi:hypothetical protein
MSYISAPRKVVVTARKSIGNDFVPGDMPPVSTHQREMEKGLTGWTDFDAKVPTIGDNTAHLPIGMADERLAEVTIGHRTFKRAAKASTVRVGGPGAAHAARLAAAERAANATDWQPRGFTR